MIFILGNLTLFLGISILLYDPLGDFLNSLSEQEIQKLTQNPFYEISRTSFNIYLITYILFAQLPEKSRNAKFLMRGIYFLFFYLFCYLIYFWIWF